MSEGSATVNPEETARGGLEECRNNMAGDA
jgi:hypothetical protein